MTHLQKVLAILIALVVVVFVIERFSSYTPEKAHAEERKEAADLDKAMAPPVVCVQKESK